MAARELRQMLPEVENQQMTIGRLKNILFEVENQDAELIPTDLMGLMLERVTEKLTVLV